MKQPLGVNRAIWLSIMLTLYYFGSKDVFGNSLGIIHVGRKRVCKK